MPGVEINGKNVVTYEEQILDEELPGSIIIAGSGAIGVEFAYVMANFGVDVTIVEFMDRMVPAEDPDVSKELAKHYKKLGVKVLTSTAVKKVEDTGDGVKVTVAGDQGKGEEQALEADKFLAAFGFAPRVEGYGLDEIGVALSDKGAIAIDDYMRTNVDGVYAIGDVTAKMMLAHVAEAMGIVAAETIAGAETMPIDYRFIPRATYCHPQIGSFGYSEAQAKEKGYDVKTATFPFSANGKAQGLGEGVGFVKIVADAEHNEILGAHMIGPDVTELLPVLTLAQKWDLTADEVARVVFAHPTLGEAVKEAVGGGNEEPRRHRRRRTGRLRGRPRRGPIGRRRHGRRHRRTRWLGGAHRLRAVQDADRHLGLHGRQVHGQRARCGLPRPRGRRGHRDHRRPGPGQCPGQAAGHRPVRRHRPAPRA